MDGFRDMKTLPSCPKRIHPSRINNAAHRSLVVKCQVHSFPFTEWHQPVGIELNCYKNIERC